MMAYLGLPKAILLHLKKLTFGQTPRPLSFAQKQTFSWRPLGRLSLVPDKSIFHFPLKAFTICLLHCWYCSLVLFQFIHRKVNLRHDIHFPHPIPRQAAEKVFPLVLHQTGCDICAGHLSGTQMMVASLDIRRINLSPPWPCHLNRSCLVLDIYNDIITKMAPGSKQKGSMELFKHQGTYSYRAKSGRKLSLVFNSIWQLCVWTVCKCVCVSNVRPCVNHL